MFVTIRVGWRSLPAFVIALYIPGGIAICLLIAQHGSLQAFALTTTALAFAFSLLLLLAAAIHRKAQPTVPKNTRQVDLSVFDAKWQPGMRYALIEEFSNRTLRVACQSETPAQALYATLYASGRAAHCHRPVRRATGPLPNRNARVASVSCHAIFLLPKR